MSGSEPSILANPAMRRRIPCPCGFDLRGRLVGERCPECGWTIDAPGPAWCTPEQLARMQKMALLARIPCLLLLLVPFVFLLGIFGFREDGGWIAALVLFSILMPLQVVTQAVAIWRIAAPELGAKRVRALRVSARVRIVAFVVGTGIVLLAVGVAPARSTTLVEWAAYALYLLIPLLAIGSDFVTLRTLGSLRGESRALVSGSYAVLPPIARWSLIPIYLLFLVPVAGWFFAPIMWAVVMSIGFAQVGAVAEAARKSLPE